MRISFNGKIFGAFVAGLMLPIIFQVSNSSASTTPEPSGSFICIGSYSRAENGINFALSATGSFFYLTTRFSYFRVATKELAAVEAPELGAELFWDLN